MKALDELANFSLSFRILKEKDAQKLGKKF